MTKVIQNNGQNNTSNRLFTQTERIAQAILEIKPDVTPEDRKAAYEDPELDLSAITIDRCLTGKVLNADTGIKVLDFFRNRIEAREKILRGEK